MPDETAAAKKKLLLKLAAVGVLALLVGVAVLRGLDWRALFHALLGVVQAAGPLAFFAGLAILPAFGAPTSAFLLVAGTAFGARMGMGGVVAAAMAATAVNLVLTYWLARWGLRPWLERLVERLGYRLPEVESGDATDLIVVLRMTPGIPFCVQNYLLGLADAPVGRYLVLSAVICLPQAAAFAMFGDALRQGKGLKLLFCAFAVVALAAAAHLVRRHWGRRNRNLALGADKP